jgi:uncharacterized membrane protein
VRWWRDEERPGRYERAPTSAVASVSTSVTPANPIAAEIASGGAPACKLTVGLPTDVVVAGATAESVDVRCFTGATVADDHTGATSTTCDPTDPASASVYFWWSTQAGNLDQNVYAAKKDGVVVVVPGKKADEFFKSPSIASVLLAVGNC